MVLAATRMGFAQDGPSAAPTVKTFATAPDASGAAAGSVNLFTGDVALPMNLIALPGHNGLDVNVSISYSSNVQHQVNVWNQDAPTGVLGLGWQMDIPKIVCDHKQTGAREDDTYYIVEGGVSNRLVRTTSGTDAGGVFYLYEAKNYQFWRIKYYYDPSEIHHSPGYGSGPNKWEITKEDGTRYVYGDKNSGRQTVQWVVRWGNWIGNSAQTTNQSRMASIWNLSEINNRWGEKMTFAYANVEQFVGSTAGQQHTEASYLSRITDALGRKVVFHYRDKNTFVFNGLSSAFYVEPHTEQAEPDAYQEVYERNYLDYIEVLREDNRPLLSVHLGYSALDAGMSTAKMLLRSIGQKNAAGQSLPGMQFSYHPSGATKGFLGKVLYPTGGSVSYGYTAATLAHSDRESPGAYANAPSGYREPKVWCAEDYVVTAWRKVGANNRHDTGPQDVKLYVNQWTGEWTEQYLRTVGNVEMVNLPANDLDDYSNYAYKDFQVTVQKDFFAVLKRNGGNAYSLFIEYKDEQNRGRWLEYYAGTLDMGDGLPTLFSGENFVGVGPRQDLSAGSSRYPTRLYTFQGNAWKEDTFHPTRRDYNYTAANNYLISQSGPLQRGGGFPPIEVVTPEFNFHVLSEDKKWTIKANSLPVFAAREQSYWSASHGFALAIAGNHPEYIYRWDPTYTHFYRDDVLGGFKDEWTYTYMPGNSLVGLVDGYSASLTKAIAARFDGVAWRTSTSEMKYYNSFGDDFFLVGLLGNTTYRRTYNANTLTWEHTAMTFTPSATMGGSAKNPLKAGNNCFFVSDQIYFRKPNGTWSPDITLTLPTGYVISDRTLFPLNPLCFTYEVWAVNGIASGPSSSRIHFIKNGGSRHFFTSLNARMSKDLHNPYTLVAFPKNTYIDATGVSLYRILNDNVSGKQTDYPVTLITANDGTQDYDTSLDYNYTTATTDPGGSVAQYNEVTMIPGSAVATDKPYGYTKTFFYNGLTGSDMGGSYFSADLKWTGAPYATRVYNSSNVLVSSSHTRYTTYSRDLKNDANTKVEVAYYVRTSQTTSTTDGITSTTTQEYDANTGLVNYSRVDDHNSKGSGNFTLVRYKYYWEQYDPTRASHILSPVIQTKTSVVNGTETVVGVSATTWKSWNGVMAPYKTYQWKRSGAADFDFTAYQATEPPAAQWFKASQVDAIDATGNVLQMSTR